jgi:hypothetical protein
MVPNVLGAIMQNKVMIAVPTQEYARRADFYDYLNMIEKDIPNTDVGMTMAHGQSPARNRNQMIDMSLANAFTHILFIDDDCVPRPDILKKLLAHNVDIVTGLYLMRSHPHFPILFDESYTSGECRYAFLYPGKQGLIEVKNTGLGACLIKTDVFRKMADDKPWIRLGQCEKDHWCDDIDFFNRARDLYGYKIYCDLECPVGHMLSATIFPLRKPDGTWATAGTFDSKNVFELPQSVPSADEMNAYIEKHKLQQGSPFELVK